ncbi:MAG: nuclear transport factor 2 family protein [Bacteroidota bacterium]
MKASFFYVLLSFLGFYGDSDLDEILATLSAQTSAWNEGDLEAFMDGYWRSDELMFIGSRGVTYGWEATLENYQKGYPDRATMGTLEFTILETIPLENKHYLVIGKWHLARSEMDDAEGHFSLTWAKKNGKWVIIADHSS